MKITFLGILFFVGIAVVLVAIIGQQNKNPGESQAK